MGYLCGGLVLRMLQEKRKKMEGVPIKAKIKESGVLLDVDGKV